LLILIFLLSLEVQAIRRRTSQRIGELMSNFQKASNSDVLQWPLTDVQMGLSG